MARKAISQSISFDPVDFETVSNVAKTTGSLSTALRLIIRQWLASKVDERYSITPAGSQALHADEPTVTE